MEKTGQCRLSCWCIHNHCLRKKTIVVKSVGNCVIQYDTVLMSSWNLVPLNKNSCGACVVPTDISRRSTWSCKDSGRNILKVGNEKSFGNNYLKQQLLLLSYVPQFLKLKGQFNVSNLVKTLLRRKRCLNGKKFESTNHKTKQQQHNCQNILHFGDEDSCFCSTCPQTHERFQPVLTLCVGKKYGLDRSR